MRLRTAVSFAERPSSRRRRAQSRSDTTPTSRSFSRTTSNSTSFSAIVCMAASAVAPGETDTTPARFVATSSPAVANGISCSIDLNGVCMRLLRGPAAVDRQCHAADLRRRLRAQEYRSRPDLLGCGELERGLLLGEQLHFRFLGGELVA